MKRLLLHPWVTVRAQLALGAVFLAAALPKVLDPPAFAKAIWNYQTFPAWSIHPAALVLPWLELLCGAALCLGARQVGPDARLGCRSLWRRLDDVEKAQRPPIGRGKSQGVRGNNRETVTR